MNILKNIFSITNKEGKNNKIYKVITICGIKFKILNKYKTLLNTIKVKNNELKIFSNSQQKEQRNAINVLKNEYSIISNKTKRLLDDIEKITPQSYLKSIAIDISHHCNLNCQNCDHFSPLAEPKFYDLEQIKSDIKCLSELSDKTLGIIKLMGGEPLLNPRINEYMQYSREYFPNTRIEIVSNGIILNNQPIEFWENCNKYNITIVLTKYPINTNYVLAEETAKKYNVSLEYYGSTNEIIKQSYHMPLDLEGMQDCKKSFLNCYHANNCVMLKDGKIYTCTVAPNIEHFNKYFGKDLPLTDYDGIDIYKANNIQEVLQFLAKPIPFCRFCNVNGRTFGHKWEISKKDISEWT